jgi:hypothetical protein
LQTADLLIVFVGLLTCDRGWVFVNQQSEINSLQIYESAICDRQFAGIFRAVPGVI